MKKGFTKVPNSVIHSGKELTDEEFRLYCSLLSYEFQKSYVYPGRETLAKLMGASRAKVDRVKKNLEQKGAFRKKRRGQGKTNLYYINENFLTEADNSQVSPLGDSSVSGKQDLDINTQNYNYLKTSNSTKETNLGENPRRGTKTPTDVVFRNHLKRYRPLIEEALVNTSEPISNDIDAAYEGIIYYIRKYGHSFSENHPLYKKRQLINCVYGVLYGMWEIEQRSLPTGVALKEVIDRWFATTSYQDKNKLRLSVFASPDSSVFYRCFEGVLSDGESYRRITSAII